MQKALLLKFIMIGLVSLLLLIPITMADGLISERNWQFLRALQQMEESKAGAQTVSGAMISIPYYVDEKVSIPLHQRMEEDVTYKVLRKKKYFFIMAEELNIQTEMTTETLKRGIYNIQTYQSRHHLSGSFKTKDALEKLQNKGDIDWQQAQLIFGVSDVRGIYAEPKLTLNQTTLPLSPGAGNSLFEEGFHARLSSDLLMSGSFSYQLDLSLSGMERLSYLPNANYTNISLHSNWPHPSFFGKMLPQDRQISDAGFQASWASSRFNNNFADLVSKCQNKTPCTQTGEEAFGVKLFQGIDLYSQIKRSLKYSFLFIGITFVTFFLLETVKSRPIHAIQYGLVGIALTLFYVLLTSLSEHINYLTAYLIASLSCAGLLGGYLSAALRSRKLGWSYFVALEALYLALYLITKSEDYALLLGSLLIFSVLAGTMYATRHVDWYQLKKNPTEK